MPIPIVGQNIKRYREAAGLSQAELAKLVGTSASQIGKYERALQDMTLTRVRDLEKAMNLQSGELLTGIDRHYEDRKLERLAEKMLKLIREFEQQEGV